MRHAFGIALKTAIDTAGAEPAEVGERAGTSADTIYRWMRGETEPKWPALTFAIEEFLRVSPGDLSRHLGYVPVAGATNLAAAIDADPRLTVEAKEMLRAAYRAAVKASRGDTRDQVERHA